MDQYLYLLTYFLLFAMVIKADGTLDYLISTVEEIAPVCLICLIYLRSSADEEVQAMVSSNPQPPKDHKVIVLGLTWMLTQSDIVIQEPNILLSIIFAFVSWMSVCSLKILFLSIPGREYSPHCPTILGTQKTVQKRTILKPPLSAPVEPTPAKNLNPNRISSSILLHLLLGNKNSWWCHDFPH